MGFFSTAETLKLPGLDQGLELGGVFAGLDVELVGLLAIDGIEAGEEALALLRQLGFDGPVFIGLEPLDLGFAVGDDAQGHRLHAAGRAGAGQLAPQDRREGEADEIIEGAARQIGIDQRLVDVARDLHRGGDGILGDGVEQHAADRGVLLDRLFLAQHIEHVPGNGLAFAIRVSCQDQFVGALEGIGNVGNALLGGGVDLPGHGEIFVGTNRAILGRQIADMAEGGQDFIA